MPAAGVISLYSKLHDVAFERTDASPAQQGDVPIYETSASKLYMGAGGGAGSFSLGASTGGNTVGDTGVTGTRIVLAAIGNLTLSQSTDAAGATISISEGTTGAGGPALSVSNTVFTDGTVVLTGAGGGATVNTVAPGTIQISVAAPVAQSVQTQSRFNLTAGGNTAGVLQEVSSGTLTLAGGNGITLSQNGNAITISGGTQSVQPETQTFLGGLAASNTTFTSGTVTVVGSGDITVLSGTGQRIIISGSQSVQPETQTFVGGISASDALFTSGTVRITGVGGGVTVGTNTGQRIDISVAAPVAQTGTQFSAGISGGNTSGHSGTVAGRLVLAGGNNVTLSGSTNGASETITISAGDVAFSAGVSNIGNTAGDTGITGTRLVLSGGQSISLSQSTNASGATVMISGASTSQSVQTQNMVALTLSGNTAGAQALMSSGTVTIAGGNNITVSQNGNGFTISGPNVGGAQTGISGIFASDASYTSGTVEFTGSNMVTVRSSAGQRVVIDASQSVQSVGLYAVQNTTGQSSSTTRDARSISFAGDGAASVGFSAGSIRISVPVQTVESQSFGMSNIGNTSGTTGIASGGAVRFLLAGGNNVTLSQSLNGASGTITISAASQTNQTLGLYALGNTTGQSSSTTRDARSISVEGAGIISVGYSGGSLRISATESVQTQGILSAGVSTGGNTVGNTQVSTGSRLVLAGAGIITASQATAAGASTITLSATQSVQTQGILSAGVSTGGNTLGDTGVATGSRLVFVGSNNITLSQGTAAGASTITISGPATNPSFSAGASNLGNTAGDTGVTGTRMVLVGSNNITLSQTTGAAGATVSIIGGAGGGFSAGVSDGGNTLGDTGVSGTRMVLAGIGEVTLSQATNANGNTVSISAPVQTNQSLGMYALGNTTGQSSSTTMDARTLSIRGDGIISVGYSGGSLRISASQSVQPETQTFIGGIAASDKTYTSGTVVLTGAGGGITVQSNAGQTITLSVAAPVAQTNQTLGMYAVQNTTGQSSSTTMDARTLSVAGDGAVSVGYSAGSLRISAPTQTVESQSIGASNLGNTLGTSGVASGGQVRMVIIGTSNLTVSQSLNGASGTMSLIANAPFSGGMSTNGNTAGDTGFASARLALVGSNNITLSGSTNGGSMTISIAAPSPGAAQYSVGVSTGGNTQGQTGVTGTRIVLAGTNNITLSQATDATGATISISGNPGMSVGLSTGGNTAGDTGVTGTRMVWVGSSPISLSQATAAAGGTITINAPATSSLIGTNGISVSTNGSTISVMPVTQSSFAPYDESPMVTGQQGQGTLHVMPMRIPNLQFDRIALGVQISNVTNSSNSITISQWVGIYTKNASSISLLISTSISTNFTGSGTVGSYSLYGGPKWQTIPWTTTLTASDYYVAIIMRTTTGGGAGHSVSQLCQSKFTNSAWSGILGAGSNATDQRLLGQGVYTASTSALPAAIPFASLNGSGSMVLRSPVWMLASGTV